MKVTLEELQAFTVVVDSGSITGAAEQLGHTTSGISRALRRLEGKLGATLLQRTTRRLALTEEGGLFLQHARDVIRAVEHAEEQVAQCHDQPKGRLRINAASPFMQHVIVPLVPEFRRRYPQIRLELNSDDLIIDLLEQHTDIAIRIGILKDSSIHARSLGVTRLRLLASPAYLQRRGTPMSIDDLSQHVCLGFTQTEWLNHWPLNNSNRDFYPIESALSASNGETLRQLAIRGEGIVRLSDFMTHEDQVAGRLIPILERDTVETRMPINAVYYHHTALAARIRCFLDYLGENIARHPL